ncbi:L-rhamnose mutarotase [Caulobacter sp. 73W]|uniref:L-rhamnose mutarotase n=1 Tax=Caulobacter sp. 73W TaxID=3161137 RepID=A0AB39KYQ7_9CAUL
MSQQTETVAFRMNLNPGHAAEYKRRHDDIWPELSSALIEAGVIDYQIFLDPLSGHLFAILTRRTDHTMGDLPRTEIMQRWWAMMADIMQAGADNVPVQVDLAPVFHLRR